MFSAMFLFIMANGVVGALYGVIDMNNVEAAKDFASSMAGEIMLAIVGFYFGGGLASSIKEKKNRKTPDAIAVIDLARGVFHPGDNEARQQNGALLRG